jgi:hypothetical protein
MELRSLAEVFSYEIIDGKTTFSESPLFLQEEIKKVLNEWNRPELATLGTDK